MCAKYAEKRKLDLFKRYQITIFIEFQLFGYLNRIKELKMLSGMLVQAHWRLICEHIPVKDHINVLIATNLFLKQQILQLIVELTLEKNRFIVAFAIEHFLNPAA